MKKFDPKMLDSELGENGRLVRIRGVRGTLFVLPRSKVALVLNALGRPREPNRKWYSLRRMRRQEFFELRSLVLDALKKRSLSIQEIKRAVPTSKIRTISFRASRSVVRSASNITWVVNWLVTTGTVLSQKVGTLQDALKVKRPASDIESLPNRYVLADEVLGMLPSIPQSEAQRDLVRWYLENYSPATREDVSWWTGLPVSTLKTVLSRFTDLVQIWVEGFQSPLIIPKGQLALFYNARADFPQVALLPYEDPLLKGYIQRQRFGRDKVIARAYRGGSVAPTVVIEGGIAASWRFSANGKGPTIHVQTLVPIERNILKMIEDRAQDMADFLFPRKETHVSIR
jgi:hypothetical protein